jgi:hypothetical protein
MSNLSDLQKIFYKISSKIETAQSRIERFKKSFEENPAYAFEWSAEVFESAAFLKVANPIMLHYEEKKLQPDFDETNFLKYLTEHVSDSVQNKAKYPSFSTSAPSNLMSTYELKALAETLEILKYYI